jgi:hypothetical protein
MDNEYDEMLKLKTDIGTLTGLFYKGIDGGYTAWFKEKPSVVIEAENLNKAIEELLISLDCLIRYENRD